MPPETAVGGPAAMALPSRCDCQPVDEVSSARCARRHQHVLQGQGVVELANVATDVELEVQRTKGDSPQIGPLDQANGAQVTLQTAVGIKTVDAQNPDVNNPAGARRCRVPGGQAIGEAMHTLGNIALPLATVVTLNEGPAQDGRTPDGRGTPDEQKISAGSPGRRGRLQQRIRACRPGRGIGRQHHRQTAVGCCREKQWTGQFDVLGRRQDYECPRSVVSPDRQAGGIKALAQRGGIEADAKIAAWHRLVLPHEGTCGSDGTPPFGDIALTGDLHQHFIERQGEGLIQPGTAETGGGNRGNVKVWNPFGTHRTVNDRRCHEGEQDRLGL